MSLRWEKAGVVGDTTERRPIEVRDLSRGYQTGPDDEEGGKSSRLVWLVLAVVFIAGVLVGGVVMWVT